MPLSALYELQTVRAISEHLATQAVKGLKEWRNVRGKRSNMMK